MSKLSGATSDTAYLVGQKALHISAATVFESEMKSGGDPLVIGFANKTLPTVKAHLANAERDLAAISKSASEAPDVRLNRR